MYRRLPGDEVVMIRIQSSAFEQPLLNLDDQNCLQMRIGLRWQFSVPAFSDTRSE